MSDKLIEHLRTEITASQRAWETNTSEFKAGVCRAYTYILDMLEEWDTDEIRPRSQRLYDLLREWNAVREKPDFRFGGLIAHYIKGSLYVHKHGASIKDDHTVVLHTERVSDLHGKVTPWRTSIYDESYSDRIDGLMDALERAISFEENRF